MQVNIEASWKGVLKEEFSKPYFPMIKAGILKSISEGKVVYPPGNEIFNAFNLTPFNKVKVVILGQDPYHGPGQAMGLCFSVKPSIKPPRSLNRIYKELQADVGCIIPSHGDLSSWAKQGVFMPNAILTVEAGNPASHSKIGWHHFTDAVIQAISDQKEGICFMLWGGFAKGKKKFIDTTKHHVFESAHPSPLAGNAFFGNHHFSGVNEVLEGRGEEPIDWQV
ncbi:MAG: uracil-DNA glycosylase [Saprospiraceae bacterium]|jgi:uracil-DNA glycosylase|tara:strand:- start:1126 stop:1794 length:669 start_codon:yes stop_codon:yes gene_type:complete